MANAATETRLPIYGSIGTPLVAGVTHTFLSSYSLYLLKMQVDLN